MSKIYDQVYIRVNGQPMAECTAVDTDLTADDQEVMTIMLGFAGISPSPDIRRTTLSEVTPITGMEFEFEKKKLSREEITLELQFGGSGKIATSKGFFKSVKTSGGVGQTVKVDIEFIGTATAFT